MELAMMSVGFSSTRNPCSVALDPDHRDFLGDTNGLQMAASSSLNSNVNLNGIDETRCNITVEEGDILSRWTVMHLNLEKQLPPLCLHLDTTSMVKQYRQACQTFKGRIGSVNLALTQKIKNSFLIKNSSKDGSNKNNCVEGSQTAGIICHHYSVEAIETSLPPEFAIKLKAESRKFSKKMGFQFFAENNEGSFLLRPTNM